MPCGGEESHTESTEFTESMRSGIVSRRRPFAPLREGIFTQKPRNTQNHAGWDGLTQTAQTFANKVFINAITRITRFAVQDGNQ